MKYTGNIIIPSGVQYSDLRLGFETDNPHEMDIGINFLKEQFNKHLRFSIPKKEGEEFEKKWNALDYSNPKRLKDA